MNPMPGNIGVTGKRSHRIADDTGRTSADNFGNLAVGSYLAGRNVTNNGIYPLVQRDAFDVSADIFISELFRTSRSIADDNLPRDRTPTQA